MQAEVFIVNIIIRQSPLRNNVEKSREKIERIMSGMSMLNVASYENSQERKKCNCPSTIVSIWVRD